MGRQMCVDQFSTYGSYHTNAANKCIHIVCIPLTVLSFFGMALTWRGQWPTTKYFGLELHWGCLILLHTAIPIACDLIGGVLTLFLEIFLLYTSQELAHKIGDPNSAFKFFVVLHIACWIFQLIGHGQFEHRPPAFVDNVFQMFSAPFFAVMEVLFFLGYKPSLKHECETEAKRKAQQARRSA